MAKSTDKDILKAQEQFKHLGKKEKIDYVWEYYKIHIITTLVTLALVIYFINITFINPPARTGLLLAVVDQYIVDEAREEFRLKYNELVIGDRERFQFVLDDYLFEQSDPQYLMAIQQKFMVQIAAREIDVIITDEDNFKDLIEQGLFMPIEEVFPGTGAIEGATFVSGNAEGSNSVMNYGVVLDRERCSDVYDIVANDNTLVIGFMVNTQRLDATRLFAEKLRIFSEAE